MSWGSNAGQQSGGRDAAQKRAMVRREALHNPMVPFAMMAWQEPIFLIGDEMGSTL